MNKEQFTPGPWTVGHRYGIENAIKGWTYYPIYYGKDEEQVCDIVYNKADADLIAAAPDMYAVLTKCVKKSCMRSCGRNKPCHDLCHEVKDAVEVLRKARGEDNE